MRPTIGPLIIIVMLALTASLGEACKPSGPPQPSPSAIAPRDNADVMQTIHDSLAWALPGAAAVTRLLPIDAAAKDAIVAALDRAAREGLPAVQRAIAVYRERGGGAGDCELHAASGALRELLQGVARAMFAGGYSFAQEIERALAAAGAVFDDFAPRCAVDAGFYSAGAADADALRTRASRAEVEFGRPLRPFPPIPREASR